MELKINEITIPEKITFNYEELKNEIIEKAKTYETLVYTDDDIKQAKSDKATLNKLKKALNDERIRREREYMIPFNEFKAQINEVIGIIDKPIAIIDNQIKEYEENKKLEKSHAIEELFESMEVPEWLELEKIYNPKWLNISCSMKSIETEIKETLERIKMDIAVLEELNEFSFEAIEEYKSSLNLNRAIAEGKRLADIQRRKKEQEEQARLKAEEEKAKHQLKEQEDVVQKTEAEEIKENAETIDNAGAGPQWISFSAKLTVSQALELREFFTSRDIEFKAN